ncbi:hypothetical protein [Paenibacillus xylanilyticus]|uniref:hypothetical protein n=1 Tax=Paenibacillus xylanilyticus TaxID=248903 RepID=UPI0039A2EF7D
MCTEKKVPSIEGTLFWSLLDAVKYKLLNACRLQIRSTERQLIDCLMTGKTCEAKQIYTDIEEETAVRR